MYRQKWMRWADRVVMLIDCWLEDVGVGRDCRGGEGVPCLATSSSVLSDACVAQTCLMMQEDSAVADVVVWGVWVREGVATAGAWCQCWC